MAVKIDVRERCEHCGEIIARIDEDIVWFGGHDCKVKPPVPYASPPRDALLSSVNFIPADKGL